MNPREQFRDAGYFNAGRVFSADELAEIREHYDRLLASPMRIAEKGKTAFDYWPLLHVSDDVMRRYATYPELVRIAVDLLQCDVRLWWDQAVFKRPGQTSEVPWHQDNGYAAIEPAEYVTFTVGIDAHDEENGCLWILPGSHKQGIQPHRHTDTIFFRGYEGPESGIPLPMAQGEVLVFSSLMMHRTGPNVSTRPRRSWVVQMCRADSCDPKSGVKFDDRLLLSKNRAGLAEPYRERELDLLALLR